MKRLAIFILFLVLFLTAFTQVSEPIGACLTEPDFLGIRPAYLQLSGDTFISVGEGDPVDTGILELQGEMFPWKLESFPDDTGLYGMWQLEFEHATRYLWAWTAASEPDIVRVLVMTTIAPGDDGNPHGCQGYAVNRDEFDEGVGYAEPSLNSQ